MATLTWLLAGILRVCGLELATTCLALLVLLLFGTDALHPAGRKGLSARLATRVTVSLAQIKPTVSSAGPETSPQSGGGR